MMVSSSTNPPPPPHKRPQRVRSRSRSSNHRNSNSCNDLQRNNNSSPPSQMLSSRISSPMNTSSSSSSGKRRWRNPFARSNSTGNSSSPSPIYNRPNLSRSQSRPNSRGRTQGRSSTAPGYISNGMPTLPFSNDINQNSRSGSAPTSHSTRHEKVNTSCAQNNNTSRSSSRGRLQRPTSDRRLANRTTKHSRSPPPLLERRAVYQPVCNNSDQRGNIAKQFTQNVQQQQQRNKNVQQRPQNHDRRSYDLNSELVNSIREIYHIIPAPPPPQQQQNASQNVEIGQKQNGISPPNNSSVLSNGSKSPNNPRTVAPIRSQPPPPPPKRNQPQKQHAPPPPRVSNSNLSEFVMYTPEEFERLAATASVGQQSLLKYPPPPPPKQLQQQQHEQQQGKEEGNRKPARRRSRSNEFGLSSSLVKRLSKEEEEQGNVTLPQQLLDISESTREGLPFDIVPTITKQDDSRGVLLGGKTYRRTKSQDNVSSSSQGQGQDEYNKSNMTFNMSEFRDALEHQLNEPAREKGHEERGERRMSFMTKTRRQLSHAQEVIALVANPTASSSNASKSTARSGSKSADQNDIEHHQQQQQQGYQEDEQSNKQHLGFRHDYNLGDTARTSSHMIIETDNQRAIENIGTLSSHDFAFVKRSDGTYSYSILAYRSSSTQVEEESLITRPPQLLQGEEVEESMTFVLSNAGCTKIIKKSQWSQCIRLVASEEEEDGTAQSLPVTVLQPDKTATAAKETNESPDQEAREVQSNPDVEIYLKKIRDQTYNTTQEEKKKQPLLPGDPGWKPPDTLAFNTNMDDDLISCISTPIGLTRENDDGQDKKIAISTQPVIQE